MNGREGSGDAPFQGPQARDREEALRPEAKASGVGVPMSIPDMTSVEAWSAVSGGPLSRRQFAVLLAAGGASAFLPGCRSETGAMDPEVETAWFKNPDPFIRHATNLETRLELLDGLITPNDLFFVRNHAATPMISTDEYRLRVTGDGVERSFELSLDDLRALPSQSLVAYLECAGNWRGFFARVMAQAAEGTQWGTGAVGCAEWSGPALASVLEAAGLRPEAVAVNLVGLDDGGFSRPMPVAKAMDPDTLLALTMNGEPLPPDHGSPVRGVVPGWAGSNSIKWVGEIQVSTEPIWVRANTSSYVLAGPDWPAERYAPADGAPVTTLPVKSALALPWPASVPAGRNRIRGFAYSNDGPIESVEWSADDGASWASARLIGPSLRYAWTRFEIEWDAAPGSHTLRTRARDAAGNTQPAEAVWNQKGYLLNVVLPHPVEVT